MYKQNYDVLNDKEDIEILELYVTGTSTDPQHHKCAKTAQELIHEPAKDSYFRQASYTVGLLGPMFNYNQNGFLDRTTSIDGAVQKFIPTSPQLRPLYYFNYPRLAGQPDERRIYDKLQCKKYWLNMANDVYTTVRYFWECVQNKPLEN